MLPQWLLLGHWTLYKMQTKTWCRGGCGYQIDQWPNYTYQILYIPNPWDGKWLFSINYTLIFLLSISWGKIFSFYMDRFYLFCWTLCWQISFSLDYQVFYLELPFSIEMESFLKSHLDSSKIHSVRFCPSKVKHVLEEC